jgi:hypothetical protein
MRRLLVLSVAALAIGGLTAGSASARQRSAGMIVCPVTASMLPCCGPPIAEADAVHCCPGPVQSTCLPNLTIGASPDPIAAGAKVTVSGALLYTASSAAGVTVQLWQEVAGDDAFSQAGTATTDGSGTWSMTIPAGSVMTNRSWYATADGLRSVTVSEAVSAVVTLRAGAAALHGSVTPGHARDRVWLQRRSGGRWVTVARTRLSRHSTFSFARAGIHGTVRVLFAADKENALSVSKQLVLP